MKRILCIIISAAVSAAFSLPCRAAGEEKEAVHSGWQVQVGGAYASLAFMNPQYVPALSAEVLYTPESHNWFSVGFTVSTPLYPAGADDGRALKDKLKKRLEDELMASSYMFSFRGTWLRRSSLSLYSEVELGYSPLSLMSDLKLPALDFVKYVGYELVPVGVTFGKKVYGFAEAGYGHQYWGGRAGIGYRF